MKKILSILIGLIMLWPVQLWATDYVTKTSTATGNFEFSVDADLGSSDTIISSQNAVKSYVDTYSAPASAYLITTRNVAALTNATNLGSLSTGLLKMTVSGGIAVLSTAVDGTDYIGYYAALVSINSLTETNGGLLYGTADNTYAWLAAGTSGYLLQGNGAGAPTWVTALANGFTATTQSAGDNSTKVATTAYANALVSDTAYASSWNGVTAIAPSKNAVYDQVELKVSKSLYDAHTVLYATTNDTPAALTVTEQTVVGRVTGGNISAVVIGIADDNIVQIDQADAADNDYAKFTANGLEGRSYAEVLSDIGAAPTASPTLTGTVTLPKTIEIQDTSADHQYVLAVSELTADRTVTLPLLTGADEFVFKDFIQTLTNKTLTSAVLTTPQINDTSLDHQYIFVASELIADRNVTLPLLGAADTFMFLTHHKAASSDITTGTEDNKYVTPDGLAGSDYGKRIIELKLTDDATSIVAGDGKVHFFIPAELNGYNLVGAHAAVSTVSSSGTPTYQIYNVTQTADMLSTRITIDANEKTSYTAAAAPVIDTDHDGVATGDELRIDKDVAGTGSKGDTIILVFQLP